MGSFGRAIDAAGTRCSRRATLDESPSFGDRCEHKWRSSFMYRPKGERLLITRAQHDVDRSRAPCLDRHPSRVVRRYLDPAISLLSPKTSRISPWARCWLSVSAWRSKDTATSLATIAERCRTVSLSCHALGDESYCGSLGDRCALSLRHDAKHIHDKAFSGAPTE